LETSTSDNLFLTSGQFLVTTSQHINPSSSIPKIMMRIDQKLTWEKRKRMS